MRPTRLAVLALVVLGLFAFIWFYERKLPSTDQRREQEGKLLPQLVTDKVTGVAIHNRHGEFRLAKESNAWKLVAPVKDDANGGAVNSLLAQLAALKAERSLQRSEVKLADYGLEPAPTWVEVQEDSGKSYRVSFGQELPLGNTVAALTEGQKVYIVSKWIVSDLEKDLSGWRSTDLLPFFTADVNALTVVSPQGRLAAARAGNAWRLTEPVADLAEREEVEGILSDLAGARIKEFLDTAPSLADLGLAAPRVSVTLVRKEGSPLTLAFGRERDGSSGREVACQRGERVFWVEASATSHLLKDPKAFRSGKLLQFSTWQVDKLTLQRGEQKVVLERKEGVWRNASGQGVDSGPIFSRLSTLAELKVLAFDQPQPSGGSFAQVEVAGQEGLEAKVSFYPSSTGGQVLAVVAGRPLALAVDRAKVEELFADLASLGKPQATPTPANK